MQHRNVNFYKSVPETVVTVSLKS